MLTDVVSWWVFLSMMKSTCIYHFASSRKNMPPVVYSRILFFIVPDIWTICSHTIIHTKRPTESFRIVFFSSLLLLKLFNIYNMWLWHSQWRLNWCMHMNHFIRLCRIQNQIRLQKEMMNKASTCKKYETINIFIWKFASTNIFFMIALAVNTP